MLLNAHAHNDLRVQMAIIVQTSINKAMLKLLMVCDVKSQLVKYGRCMNASESVKLRTTDKANTIGT